MHTKCSVQKKPIQSLDVAQGAQGTWASDYNATAQFECSAKDEEALLNTFVLVYALFVDDDQVSIPIFSPSLIIPSHITHIGKDCPISHTFATIQHSQTPMFSLALQNDLDFLGQVRVSRKSLHWV